MRTLNKKARGITDVKAAVHCLKEEARNGEDRIFVMWTHAGALFHIWLSPDGKPENNKVYKNPPPEIKYGKPGYFSTRYLAADGTVNAAMIAEAMQRVDLDEARACYIEAERRKKEQNEKEQLEREMTARRHAASPAMEAALRQIAKIGGNLSDEALETATGPNDARARGIMVTGTRAIALAALAELEAK